MMEELGEVGQTFGGDASRYASGGNDGPGGKYCEDGAGWMHGGSIRN